MFVLGLAVLEPEYQAAFAVLTDQAPAVAPAVGFVGRMVDLEIADPVAVPGVPTVDLLPGLKTADPAAARSAAR